MVVEQWAGLHCNKPVTNTSIGSGSHNRKGDFLYYKTQVRVAATPHSNKIKSFNKSSPQGQIFVLYTLTKETVASEVSCFEHRNTWKSNKLAHICITQALCSKATRWEQTYTSQVHQCTAHHSQPATNQHPTSSQAHKPPYLQKQIDPNNIQATHQDPCTY